MSTFRALACLFLAAMTVSACADTTAPETDSLDEVLAQVAEVETYAGMGAAASGVPVLSSRHTTASSCTFTAASSSFSCPTITHNGMTLARAYQLLDGADNPQSAYDPATTASVRTIIDLSGAPTNQPGGGVTLEVSHHSDHTVGGLLTTTRTLGGTASTAYTFTDADGSFTLTASSETSLTLPPSGTVNGFPTGTISYEITSSEGGSPVVVTATFDGTSTAMLTHTFDGVTRTCTMNLATPGQAPVCS